MRHGNTLWHRVQKYIVSFTQRKTGMYPKVELRVVVGDGDPLCINGEYFSGDSFQEAENKAHSKFKYDHRLVRFTLFRDNGELTRSLKYIELVK